MASVTLAESAKLDQNELVAGVIETLITVNQMYELLPFDGIEGNALQYTRENALGDVIVGGVDTKFSVAGAGKAPATFTTVTTGLTTIMGDAEVNGMIQATRSGDGNDQTAIQVASKAKSAGRKFQSMLINGTGADNEFTGLLSLCASGQKVDTGATGKVVGFDVLDELLDLITDKDGTSEYILMNSRTTRSYKALLRGLGGANITETVELPSGAKVMSYSGVPIFKNDYIPTNQSKGGQGNCTTILAGTFDDGSRTHGVAGLTAAQMAGIQVVDVGEAEDSDNHITRVKWYAGACLFSEKGLALADGIRN